ncbi:MAG: GntR family transcriptional regulator [Spirochaetes bacterium]|nr:MAG: GntR family transcriptional regulator [Spirochaetota bacterium]
MIAIGDYNRLKVSRKYKGGLLFETERGELFLPKIETPEGIGPGDEIEVFIYNKDKGELAATTVSPLARVNEFAALEVVDIQSFGAFLDWGIEKDLFLPNRRQTKPIQIGEKVVVRLVPDFEGQGIVADMDLEIYFEHDTSGLKEDREVALIVYGLSPLGFKVVVNKKYPGLVYRSEGYREPVIGDELSGYIAKIREDGKLDISLKKKGYAAVTDSKELLLEAIEKAGGFLPLHDKSDPELIKDKLGMSKKLFKKTAGTLYREGVIVIESGGLRLIK